MRLSALLYLLVMFGVGTGFGFAEETDSLSLRVITFNVQFLPGFAAVKNDRGEPTYRAEEIGRRMSEYDIIGLQEAFDTPARERILGELQKAWGEAYHAVVHEPPGDGRGMGGLLIASRWPILESHHFHYRDYSDPSKRRPDDFVAKGIVHARVARSREGSKDFVDVFVTHLVAGDNATRPPQYAELAMFVRQHGDKAQPAIILGDMNTDGKPSERAKPQSRYNLMTSLLRDARETGELIDVFAHSHPDEEGGTNNWEDGGKDKERKRIDYIFVLQPEGGKSGLKEKSAVINRFEDARLKSLSNHSAVEAILEWSVTGMRPL